MSPIEGTFMSRPNPVTTKGLAGVVEGFFGLPLDKRDQISDWDRRPLTENQIVYAALDAFVLLEIYEALM